MKRIVLATNNGGKLREIQAMLAECAIEVLPQSAWDVPEVREDGASFVANALLKARHAARQNVVLAARGQRFGQ